MKNFTAGTLVVVASLAARLPLLPVIATIEYNVPRRGHSFHLPLRPPSSDRHCRDMEPLLKVNLAAFNVFFSPQEMELAATTRDGNDVRTYVPGRFITKMKQRVEDTTVDLLTSVPLHTLSALPITEDEEPDLSLISASAIALGGQGSPEDKTRQARTALLRNICERLIS